MAMYAFEEKRHWFHIISSIVFCFIIANLVYLNVLITQSKQHTSSDPIAVTPTIGPSQLLLTPTARPTESLTQDAEDKKDDKSNDSPKQQSVSLVKEYFIPFGSGMSSAGEWEDLLGLQAYIDGNSYPGIDTAVFEVSLHNIAAGQEVYVRLYNATDNHVVWGSDIKYTKGNTSEMLVSKPITLAAGRKLYKVQVRTQLQAQVMIDVARLHITLE